MSEQYIDPNSGAAAQPGGASIESPAPIEAVVGQDGSVENIDAQELEAKQLEQADKQAELDQTGVQTYVASGDLVVDADGNDQVVTKTIEGAAPKSEDSESESEGSAEETPADSTEQVETQPEEPVEAVEAVEAYDPSAHTADQVLEYILENPDQQEAVLAAEAAGKNRKTVTNAF